MGNRIHTADYWLKNLDTNVKLFTIVKDKRERIRNLTDRIARQWVEIKRYQTTPCQNYNHYRQLLWNIKHNELSIAFAYSECKQLEKELASIEVLYGNKT